MVLIVGEIAQNLGIAKLSLNSTQLNFNFNFEAEIALFQDNTATHRESSKMEQDFKYFNWRLQILQFKTSNTSIKDFKYFNWRFQILAQLSLNSISTPA